MKYFPFTICLLLYHSLHAQNDRSHYFISFDKTRIYYEDKGTGYPIVLIHGFLNTSQNWKRTILYKALQQAGYRVIIPDLRGNGNSGKPHTVQAYEHDAEAKDIIALVSSLHLNSYSVIGYSRGSIIATRMLLLDKRIQKAVLGGMGTGFTDPEWPRRKMFYHLLNGDTIVQELEPLLKRLQTDTTLDRSALTLQQKEQPSADTSSLKKIKKPVLVICGIQDTDNGNAKQLSGYFGNGMFKQIAGDHGSAWITKEFSDTVLSFLTGNAMR